MMGHVVHTPQLPGDPGFSLTEKSKTSHSASFQTFELAVVTSGAGDRAVMVMPLLSTRQLSPAPALKLKVDIEVRELIRKDVGP